jgi:hypothetical protein
MVDTTAGAGANAGAEGGTDNTDTSLNGEYRAGAGIYVNASGQWTDPDGNTLRGEALMNAEANASAKYGVGYRDDNLYLEAVAEAKLRAEAALKAEYQNGDHAAGVELYAYAELYAWAGVDANAGSDGCWFEGGAIAGAKAGVGNRTYYTNESLGVAVVNDTSVSVGAQVGGTIGGGYHVPDWNKDSKPITIGGSMNLALIVGVKTEGSVTVDVDPVYDMGESAVGESHGLIEDTKTVVVENVVAPVQETIAPVVAPVQEHFVAPIQDTVGKIGDVFGGGGKKKKKKKGPFGF